MTRSFRGAAPRRLAGAALGLVLLGTLAACGDEAAPDSGADALSTVDLIFDGALTVCTDMPYAPFEYKENGQPTGFDIEVARSIADDLDVQLDVIDSPFDAIVSGEALNTDICDMAISAISITGERSRVVDFSSPYFNAKQALIAPVDSELEITGVESFAGRRVGVQGDTTGEKYLRDATQTKIITYDDAALLEEALASGSVQAIVMDGPAAADLVAGDDSLRVVAEYDAGEQYGIAVQKDDNVPLLRRINTVLAKMQEDGSYQEIHAKYF